MWQDTRRPETESTSWPPSNYGDFHPYVFPYLHPAAFTLQVSSVWLTLAFTVDRYIMICHPFKAEMFCTTGRARSVVAALVISSIVFNIPKFFEYRTVVVPPPPAAVQLSAAEDVAVVGSDLTWFGRSRVFKQLYHSWFYIVFVFGVPFVSLVVLNAFLVNAVRMSRKRSRDLRPPIRRNAPDLVANAPAYQLEAKQFHKTRKTHKSHKSFTRSPESSTYQLEEEGTSQSSCAPIMISRQSSSNCRLERHAFSNASYLESSVAYQLEGLGTPVPRSRAPVPRSPSPETRRIDTTVMLIGVVIIFIVCQFPALVSRAIWAFSDNSSGAFTELPLYSLNEIANFLVLLNSSVNIVPYYFFGRRFRRQFLALFCPYCDVGRRADRRRARCDSAADSALFSYSASHHRDSAANQHCL